MFLHFLFRGTLYGGIRRVLQSAASYKYRGGFRGIRYQLLVIRYQSSVQSSVTRQLFAGKKDPMPVQTEEQHFKDLKETMYKVTESISALETKMMNNHK